MITVRRALFAGALTVVVLSGPTFIAGGWLGTRLANRHRCESIEAQPDRGLYGATYHVGDNTCRAHTVLGDVTLPMRGMWDHGTGRSMGETAGRWPK